MSENIHEIEKIVSLIKDKEIIFFVGSGVSLPYYDLPGFISASDLSTKLKMELLENPSVEIESETFMQLAQRVIWNSSGSRHNVEKLLVKEFDRIDVKPLPAHNELINLGCDIITTNYDCLLEQSFRNKGIRPTVLFKDEHLPSVNNPLLIKIHGCISNPNSCVISENDYYKWFDENSELVSLIKTLFITKTICFIGYSFNDFNFKFLLHNLRVKFGILHRQSYMIMRNFEANDYNYLYTTKSLGLKIIKSDATEFLKALNNKLGNTDITTPYDNIFKEEYFRKNTNVSYTDYIAKELSKKLIQNHKEGNVLITNEILLKIQEYLQDYKYEINYKNGVALIPRGFFIKGGERLGNESIMLNATQKDFYLSTYPVTNLQYKRFLNAISMENIKKHLHPSQPADKSHFPDETYSYKNTPSDYFTNKIFDNFPVVNIDWWDAYAYCSWVGGRLPTELEWEKASRGIDGRIFPWGNDFSIEKLCTEENGYLHSVAVDYYPDNVSPYGIIGMAGNTWEWCFDLFNNNELIKNESRVVKGGSFSRSENRARSAFRNSHPPEQRFPTRGFRVAFDNI